MIKVWLAVFGVALLISGCVGGIIFVASLMPNLVGVGIVTIIGVAIMYATAAAIAWKVAQKW